MKLKMKYFAIPALVFFTLTTNAQRFKVTDGDIAVLKDQKEINVEFTYNDMSVGKYEHESEYIEKKKAEYNAKEAGRGDSWAKNWIADRKLVFEPKFIDLLEKATDVTVKPTARYTIIFHTTSTEPGYNIVISKKNAEIDATATIVETADRTKVIAVISVKNAPGRTFSGNDYATGDRIAECYAVAGKKLGKYIW